MDLNKAVEHCWDRRDYPEIISDDAGLDISIPRFITRGPWKEHNRPRRITLNVTTYIGTSWNAVHYYGNLDIEGISFSQEDSPNTMTMCSETYDAEEKNPLAGGVYHIELVRPVTREEIEEDNSRWCGYEIGDNTNAFHSPEDVIALAKEVCKARFKGNWILKIVDYSGKDLDEEILIDKIMNRFNLYEDILSRTWNRYYYEVEAETLEEAIEKVKDGEVDCYDSEQLYESNDDLAPEENNGSATREIYHEDEVVWDNAKLVNRGEIITQDLRNISDQLFHIMESEPEEFSAGCISFTLVKEVLEKLGWTDTEDLETNGWDIDYWVTFIKEGKNFDYIVSGSLYYGNINIRKEKF